LIDKWVLPTRGRMTVVGVEAPCVASDERGT
jgi:hypothetical protein